ncbi:uncharacterized protein EDB93DRAFT_822762 [Suillus bovinus]|uniref:uncharacterized protein n=1 Tax=Suillus bovinus TaxID=48563 RepID=UPI001B85EB97|nr:uncharacterized protein EDB93DRAFT_822762 [Suillus bovinus]KAG2135739.1 hypothetical protein EDB93DRAFT_822762 [Suillus bovinus]
MHLHKGFQTVLLLLLVHAARTVVAAANFSQCLNNIVQNANATQDFNGLLDSNGDPVSSVSDATSISYSMCTSRCGTGQEAFQWSEFSQEFSAWLLPNLALISQLPFGAEYRLHNFMSAVLTVGSPTLAGYSLFVTLLNSRWITCEFNTLNYHPNSRFALSILSSLQQVPLRLHPDRDRLRSLILPENHWWKYLAEFVDYTHTWSIASATSITWVVVAYILTVTNTPSEVYANSLSNGEATGAIWLWLIPIVVGWLQLSPKCDFNRLQAAYDRADRHSMHTGTSDETVGMPSASSRRALAITAEEDDVMSPDELFTPPVFNYSRSLRWASTAEAILMLFKKELEASERAYSNLPVRESNGDESGIDDSTESIETIHDGNRRRSSQYVVVDYTEPDGEKSPCTHWAPGVFTRMFIASCASLALQWGTVGAALLVAWFTPTTKIGCRSMGYLIYGGISTLVWMMLLMSSILAHSSVAAHSSTTYPRRVSLSTRVAVAASHVLRWTGKLFAILNSCVVIMACVFQYSGFYDECFCKSSVFSRGGAAYYVIIETAAQAAQAKTAWISAIVLACASASAFLIMLSLLLDTLPDSTTLGNREE